MKRCDCGELVDERFFEFHACGEDEYIDAMERAIARVETDYEGEYK